MYADDDNNTDLQLEEANGAELQRRVDASIIHHVQRRLLLPLHPKCSAKNAFYLKVSTVADIFRDSSPTENRGFVAPASKGCLSPSDRTCPKFNVNILGYKLTAQNQDHPLDISSNGSPLERCPAITHHLTYPDMDDKILSFELCDTLKV